MDGMNVHCVPSYRELGGEETGWREEGGTVRIGVVCIIFGLCTVFLYCIGLAKGDVGRLSSCKKDLGVK